MHTDIILPRVLNESQKKPLRSTSHNLDSICPPPSQIDGHIISNECRYNKQAKATKTIKIDKLYTSPNVKLTEETKQVVVLAVHITAYLDRGL